VAFAGAFLWSHSRNSESERTKIHAEAGALTTGNRPAGAKTETVAATGSAAGVLQDSLLRRALASPDLVAAVKEIMAHEQEDHCADTRVICLVESLPASRLGELPDVLAAFASNDFIVRHILGTWAQRDVAGARAWVEAHPSLNDNGKQAFLRGWTRASPEAVLAWLDEQPVSAGSGLRREAVIEAMSEKDPAAAFDLMKSRGWVAQNPGALLKLLRNWGGLDPQAAVGGLRNMAAEMGLTLPDNPKGDPRNQSSLVFSSMLSALLNGAFDRNPADAAALLGGFRASELTAGSEAIAREVLGRDPVAAAALFGAVPDENARAMIHAMPESSPSMTLRMLASIPDPELQRELLIKAAAGHQGGPRSAMVPEASRPVIAGLLASIPDAAVRASTTGTIVVANAASAPAWTAELWAGLSPGQQQMDGPAFFKEAGRTDAGVALAAYSASPPEVQTVALKGLCSGLAATQPDKALQLVLQQSEPALKSSCAATLFAYWSKSAPEAALASLESSASQLDLRAILEQLPRAGHFTGGNRTHFESVSTDAVQAKIQQLLGNLSLPPAGQ
jgi:hypothetical protein